MARISELCEQYRKNADTWNELDLQLKQNMSKIVWVKCLQDATVQKRTIYRENNMIISAIYDEIDHLSKENVDQCNENIMSLYLDGYDDASFLIYCLEKLASYYEKIGDVENCILLYNAIQVEKILKLNDEYRGVGFDFKYYERIIEYADRILEFSKKIQQRIIATYVHYPCLAMDRNKAGIKEAFEIYSRFRAFVAREDIFKLIQEDQDMKYSYDISQSAMLIGITLISTATQEEKQIIYDYAKEYFEKNRTDRDSDFELNAEEYASLLFLDYVDGVSTREEIYEKYYSYFQYCYLKIQNKDEIDRDTLIQCINAIDLLGKLTKYINDSEKVRRTVEAFMEFAEGKWMKGKVQYLYYISSMIKTLCSSILAIPVMGMQKEQCIMQLVVQRNIKNFIHGKIVGSIAMAIYEELLAASSNYFEDITVVKKEEIKQFLYQSSMFHDIGDSHSLGISLTERRSLFEEEQKIFEMHPDFGVEAIENIPEMEQYFDVIRGHHKYYDGMGGYPSAYDNTKSPYKKLVDIISLAVFIDEETDFYGQFEQEPISRNELCRKLREYSGTRFNQELVDFILQSNEFEKRIIAIVEEQRLTILYQAYRNWDKVQFAQDDESILNEILKKLEEFHVNRDEKSFEPYMEQLKRLSNEAEDDVIRGKALFYLMSVYFFKEEFKSALELEPEVTRLLKKTNLYEFQSKCHFNMAVYHLLHENQEAAMELFMTVIDITENKPECAKERIRSLLYAATIYINLQSYEKALEYLKDAEHFLVVQPVVFERDAVSIFCMEGLCYIFTEQMDEVLRCRNEVYKRIENNGNEDEYFVYVFLAWFAYALDEKDQLAEYLKYLDENNISAEEFPYYTNEVIIYLNLLTELNDVDVTAQKVDYFLELCERCHASYQVFEKLLILRISLAFKQKDYVRIAKLGEMLGRIQKVNCLERSKHMEEMELSFKKNIEVQKEQDKILAENKELLEDIKSEQDANKQKSAFLSSISHEIRTPIHAIIGMNEMVLRESHEEAVLQYATDIETAGKQLLGIVDNVMDYTKLEAGKMDIIPEKYKMKDLLEEIQKMVGKSASEKFLAFKIICDDNIPSVLFGDILRIKQIIMNLLSNAIKFTEKGSVELRFSYDKKNEDEIFLKVSVKDTGIGMSQDEITNITKPFERAGDINNRSIQGFGLGISIVTNLLKQMESKLEITSILGEGSDISFVLVQKVLDWSHEKKDESKSSLKETAKKKAASFYAPNANILIVDDNAVNVKVANGLLKRTKVKTSIAYNGEDGLKLCEEQTFHIILMDHMMPEMDGIECLKHIRESEGVNKDTIVIAVTANVINGAEEFYKNAGFDALLTKPLNAALLESTIKQFLPDYLIEKTDE